MMPAIGRGDVAVARVEGCTSYIFVILAGPLSLPFRPVSKNTLVTY